MMNAERVSIARARAAALAAICAAAAIVGCGSWPRLGSKGEPPAGPAAPTAELVVEPSPGGPAIGAVGILQYWERNTLVLDLQGVGSSGTVTLRPREGRGWPARLGLRVPPGRFASLEIRGEQRVVFPLSAGGATPLELRLEPGVYSATTRELEMRWGAADLPLPASADQARN